LFNDLDCRIHFILPIKQQFSKMKNSENRKLIMIDKNYRIDLITALIRVRYSTSFIRKACSIAIFILAISALFTACSKQTKVTVAEQEIDQLRAAIVPFTEINKGIAAGYSIDVTGYRTRMGHHFLNPSLLDNNFEITRPELLIYAPFANDTMKLVAVEYATPITDINTPPPVPEGFTGKDDIWEINTEFKLWTLHVWIGLDNPDGLFASHNHRLP
jgi:hypothetical protein